MKIDSNGTLIWTKKVSGVNSSSFIQQILATTDGGYLLTVGDNFFLTRRIIVKLDSRFTIQWQKELPEPNDYDAARKGIAVMNNNNVVFANSQTGMGFTLSKLSNLGASCEIIPNSNIVIEDTISTATVSTWGNLTSFQFNNSLNVNTIPMIITQTSRCRECKEICNNGIDDDGDDLIDEDDVVDCPCRNCFVKDTLKIVGSDTACIGSNVVYNVKSKCSRPIGLGFLFKIGTALPIAAFLDSTLTYRFTESGAYRLNFSVRDSCNSLNTLKIIHVIASPPVLELGPDKSVCKTGVFTFNAKRGFKSYLWQDGSTDSTFTAFNVGKYWVRTVDSCGGIQSDTIRITQTISPPLSLSPDTFRICEGDSIEVTAPTGFATYRWSPSAGVNDTFKRRIFLTPSVSNTYFCTVATAQGCINQDSIWVEVKPLTRQSKIVNICGLNYAIGDSIFIKTGNYTVVLRGRFDACDTLVALDLTLINITIETTSFNTCPTQRNGRIVAIPKNGQLPYSFSWNNGATGSELSNLPSGTYTLTVTDANNCTATTSVSIKETLQYPYTLTVKTPRCFGEQTGEIRLNTTEKISIGLDSNAFNTTGFIGNLRAGNYTVFVKDSNNCTFSEAITLNQPPELVVILQADTLIRLGDSLKIQPITLGAGRLTYRWQPPLYLNCDTCLTVVAKPTKGILYTLFVTDSAGCSANEKLLIDVKSGCSVFIPNVFSPFNSTGANDVFYPFRANCAQNVTNMQIFNRWGEMVFQRLNFPLNDAAFGWNGTYKGKELDAGVFTYSIDIQLVDGRLQRFSGNVMLLR